MTTIAEKLKKVSENIPKVYAAGKKKAYDEFWDTMQEKGRRTYYHHSFAGIGWTNQTFRPKYNIEVDYGQNMFSNSRLQGDLVELLENLGITIDFSGNTDYSNMFMSSSLLTRVGTLTNPTGRPMDYAFKSCTKLTTIDLIIVGASATFARAFENDANLVSITFQGTIGTNLDIHWSTKINADSIASILGCLSSASTGRTLTLPSSARATYDAKFGSGSFNSLIAAKTNWTKALL